MQVVLVPPGGVTTGRSQRLLAESALVDSASGGRNGTTGEVTVTVDSAVAPEIAAYASTGQIAVTELPGAR